MASSPICIIRKFKSGDEKSVQAILEATTMEKVGSYYQSIVLSQAFPEVAVTLVAVLFIIFSVPLKYALIGIPISLVAIYAAVWMGHWLKMNELQNDIFNIKPNYMDKPNNCFFIAEVYAKEGGGEELASLSQKVKKIEYDFVTEKEFEVKNYNISGRKPYIAGCLGITRSMLDSNSAWVRRFAVKKAFRRRHIGTELLQAAVKFCKEQKFKGMELKVTEHYGEANELFDREGFQTVVIGYVSHFFLDSCQQLHKYLRLVEPDVLNKSENHSDLLESQN